MILEAVCKIKFEKGIEPNEAEAIIDHIEKNILGVSRAEIGTIKKINEDEERPVKVGLNFKSDKNFKILQAVLDDEKIPNWMSEDAQGKQEVCFHYKVEK
ncbi:hypothetical protein Mpet_2302 [Methanolacinia petrolearia DSM 11571]|uniref:Uncharacterized protein n=1 Tax=Methanolacinia petrolearia (strain DSM 11571 / OCM 486 / SEBR 4847) TaxID=679926 RepID=E1RD66_METP4|nr:hypothetical protein [Methanolacinia petrolearia]ADN37049.1 hypothetical protein Mpet_2302 [Methanolacinia petrolearia DSM 11571]